MNYNDLESSPAPATVPKKSNRWVIVLAGGEGVRMRPLIEAWLDENRPKQFCAFTGTSSLLQQALERAQGLAEAEHIVTVIGPGQRSWLADAVPGTPRGQVIEQPGQKGNGAGVLVALAYILEQDPEAVVLVQPADLFAHPEERLQRYMLQSAMLAEFFDKQLVLLGAAPGQPETDYGWIEPQEKVLSWLWGSFRHEPMAVRRMVEKPTPAQALDLLKAGALWNTLLLAAKGQALWSLFMRTQPELTRRFNEYRLLLRAGAAPGSRARHTCGWLDLHQAALRHLYAGLPSADFSADVLARLEGGEALVLPMDDITWTDLGRPARLREVLTHFALPAGNALQAILHRLDETLEPLHV